MKRIVYFDQIRALAIIGIVICHIGGLFVTHLNSFHSFDYNFAIFLNSFALFSVPLFIMISGALLLNRKETFTVFFKKRILRIIPPLIFYVVLFIIVYLILNPVMVNTQFVLSLFFGLNNEILPAWFVWMILEVYVIFFILNKIIQYFEDKINNFHTKFIYLVLALLFVYCLLICYADISILHNDLFYRVGYVFYAVLGYVIANYTIKNNKQVLIISLILFVLLWILNLNALFINSTALHSITHLPGHYFNPLVILLTLTAFLIFKTLPDVFTTNSIIQNKGCTGQIINSISICSFGIFLLHLLFRNTLGLYLLNLNIIPAVPLMIIEVILVLALSWIVVYILSKIPYLNRFSGV